MEVETTFKENTTASDASVENLTAYTRYSNLEIIPNCIDGLKLCQRRIIGVIGTSDERLKGATLMGRVMDRHPHGDTGIMDAIVRLGQPFTQVYPFVIIKGNCGAYGGGEPAAGRYIDVQASPFSKDLFFNKVDTRTLTYIPSETGHGTEAAYFIPIIPTTLLTGAFGVSVAYKSVVPQLNLTQLCNLVERFIKLRKEYPMDYRKRYSEIAKYCIPDFPTHTLLRNEQQLLSEYSKGNFDCPVIMDGIFDISPTEIHLRSIPHGATFENIFKKLGAMMNSANFISANCTEINDLTTGTEYGDIQFKLKRGVDPFAVLGEFKRHCTFTQSWTPIWTFVDKDGYICKLNPMELLDIWYLARYRSVLGALKFINNDLFKQFRKLSALIIIADHTDEVLKIFKTAANREATIAPLTKKFQLTREQAEYIASLQLHQITHQGKDELLKALQGVKEKMENLQTKFTSIDELILQDVDYIRKTYGPKCPRRTELPDFIGVLHLKESGAYIQFRSYPECAHLFKRWGKQQQVEVIIYPAGAVKLIAHTKTGIITDEKLSFPKEFSASKLEVCKLKPRSVVMLKNGAISRVDGVYNLYGKRGILTHVSMGFAALDRNFKLVQVSTPSLPKRNSLDALGNKSDLLYFNGVQADEVVVAAVNSKSPNHVIMMRLKEGDIFKKLLLGHTEVLGMWRYGDPISFTIPQEYLSRCPVKHILIRKPEEFFGNDKRLELFLNRRKASNDKSLVQLTKGTDIYSESTIRSKDVQLS